jgi:lipid A 4'-phosphatase
MLNKRLIYANIIAFAVFATILILFPELDLHIASYFYDNELGFMYKNNSVVQLLFRSIPIMTKVFVAICVVYMTYLYIKYKNPKLILKSWAFFLFLSAIIGPGLIVNTVLKENFGRARPIQVQEFNGSKEFTKAFVITNQCEKNCSFSSGHAAMGFYFSALAYVIGRLYFSRVYMLGIIFGSIVGISRIIMGGHFASDVVISGLIILLFNHLIFLWWQKKALKSIV